tara:strand:- start:47579 stop:47728 length:150 start_codon:yes stop_codon:yes gene_type:complete
LSVSKAFSFFKTLKKVLIKVGGFEIDVQKTYWIFSKKKSLSTKRKIGFE